MLAGGLLFLSGGLIFLLSKAGFNLGRLPGDFRIETESFSCFVPLASGLMLSLLLTLAINLFNRLLR